MRKTKESASAAIKVWTKAYRVKVNDKVRFVAPFDNDGYASSSLGWRIYYPTLIGRTTHITKLALDWGAIQVIFDNRDMYIPFWCVEKVK